jgi:hypothetical protein
MKRMTIGAALVLAAGLATGSAIHPVGAAADDTKVTIAGCVVRGDGDGDGFLLANTVEETTRTTTTSGPSGTTVSSTTATALKPSRVIYWLDDDDDVVEPHMGKQVEIVGEIEGDIDAGEIDIEREEGQVELEIDADGRKATVKLQEVPSAVGTSGSVGDDEKELQYQVRKLDVKSAKVIAESCQ